MGTIGVVLLVAFFIVCFLLVLLVAVQDDGESGMGGLLGGRGTAAFGSHSANVLTKTTFVLVVLFFVLSIGIALSNKKPKVEKNLLPETVVEENSASETPSDWWSGESASSEKESNQASAE